MSQANIPNITPQITLDFDDALTLIIASIAMEELGLSHILNAEGEKLQYVLGTLEGSTPLNPTIDEVLKVNQSILDMLKSVTKTELGLTNKLETVLEILKQKNSVTP